MINDTIIKKLECFYSVQVEKDILKRFEVTPVHDDNVIVIELWRKMPDKYFKIYNKIILTGNILDREQDNGTCNSWDEKEPDLCGGAPSGFSGITDPVA